MRKIIRKVEVLQEASWYVIMQGNSWSTVNQSINKRNILKPQGGPRVKVKFSYPERSHWDEKYAEYRIKKLFIARVMIFENRHLPVITLGTQKNYNRNAWKQPLFTFFTSLEYHKSKSPES